MPINTRFDMMMGGSRAKVRSNRASRPAVDPSRCSRDVPIGQQVTGYPHNDTNNLWQILPEKPFPTENRHGHRIRNNNVVRLRHIVTNTMLLSHDVASPYYPTNQEFTTTSMENADGPKVNNTLFEIKIEHGKKEQVFSTVSSHMKLIHRPSRVAMWTHTTPLPDWGYKQQEINGNKNVAQSSNIWFVEDIHSIAPDDERLHKEPRKVKSLPFLRKYIELQRAMFFHNNALTSSHPYSSQPFQWPVLLRGVSFWTKNDTKQQIYFVGNPIGWWFAASILAVFLGIVGADQLTLRRGLDVLDYRKWICSRTRITHHSRRAPSPQRSVLVRLSLDTSPLVAGFWKVDPNPVVGHRNSISTIQLHRLLLPLLGGALPAVLSHGSATLLASLPACPPRIVPGGRRRVGVRLQRRSHRGR